MTTTNGSTSQHSVDSGLLSDKLRQAIICEIQRGWRYERATEAPIIHVAFLVEPALWFSEGDIIAIFDAVAISTGTVSWHLNRLRNDGFFIAKPGPDGVAAYKLEREMRHRLQNETRYQPLAQPDAEPEKQAVSHQLEQLESRLTDADEAEFLRETLVCLQCQAFRAAIVMGWNLAFDHVRGWIFRHHLVAFNAELTQRNRTRNQKYDAVQDKGEFPESERTVLEIARDSGILNKHHFTTLQNALNLRHRCASERVQSQRAYGSRPHCRAAEQHNSAAELTDSERNLTKARG